MIRAGGTWSWSMFFMLGTGLQGKTLGIVGLGQIGTATARRARAFGMRIVYSGRRRADPRARGASSRRRPLDLDELLAAADVVSLHCPLSAATRHLIDARRLRADAADGVPREHGPRGPVVDEAALAAGAARRHDRRAPGSTCSSASRRSSRACSSSRTSCCSRTSARRRSRRARRWACWRRATWSRVLAGDAAAHADRMNRTVPGPVYSVRAAAIAAMCAGVEPQQPPTSSTPSARMRRA